MPKKKLSDIVFQHIDPPDYKSDISLKELSKVLVRRLGLKRKKSMAKHYKLLLELLRYKKEDQPMDINDISDILGVSISQCYEELRKWRTIGLVEFVKIPVANDYIKGYMLTANTVNKLIDKVESSCKSFFRQTKRIAKDFDDSFNLKVARKKKDIQKEIEKQVKGPVVKKATEEFEEKQKEEKKKNKTELSKTISEKNKDGSKEENTNEEKTQTSSKKENEEKTDKEKLFS